MKRIDVLGKCLALIYFDKIYLNINYKNNKP